MFSKQSLPCKNLFAAYFSTSIDSHFQERLSDFDLKAEELRRFQNQFEADLASSQDELQMEVRWKEFSKNEMTFL